MEELTVRYRLEVFPPMDDLDLLLLSTINIAHSVLFLMFITVHSSNKLICPKIACLSLYCVTQFRSRTGKYMANDSIQLFKITIWL